LGALHVFYLNRLLADKRPSPEMGQAMTLGGGSLGIVTMALGVALLVRRGASGTSTRLFVYPDALVELCKERCRMIPWDKIGPPELGRGFFSTYRCAVDGGRDLTFDDGIRDHAGLCKSIETKVMESRRHLAFGGDEIVTEMAAAELGPSLLAQKLGAGSELYRVTLMGRRLLFYRVKTPCLTEEPRPMAGWLEAWVHADMRRKYLEEMHRVEQADASTLLALAQENEGSFVASAADLRRASLDPPSYAKFFWHGPDRVRQECLLTLDDRRYGRMALALLAREDVMKVANDWPTALGDAVESHVAWSHSACAFVDCA
jgi:hypothetical protein